MVFSLVAGERRFVVTASGTDRHLGVPESPVRPVPLQVPPQRLQSSGSGIEFRVFVSVNQEHQLFTLTDFHIPKGLRDSPAKNCFKSGHSLTENTMMLDGVAGFPLMDGIPRGESFVDFMRDIRGGPSSASTEASSPVGPVPGGFDENAGRASISQNITDLGGGAKRMDGTEKRTDGSIKTFSRIVLSDGTQRVVAQHRSMPDAQGYEKVRVFDTRIAADGTRDVSLRVFRVPAGVMIDPADAGMQAYFLHSIDKILPQGLGWHDVPSEPTGADAKPDTAERLRKASVSSASERPVIPLAI